MIQYILLLAVFCAVVYFYGKKQFEKWETLGVPGPKPSFVFGNMKDATLRTKAVTEVYHHIYDKFKDLPYVGIYILKRPAILLRDLEIIKDVLVKEFPSFHDNDLDVDRDIDPIFGNNPFTLKGEAWKNMRAQHSPHFTTSKVRSMYPLVEEVGTKMLNYLDEQIQKSGQKCCIEGLELAAKFTTDSVTVSSLGINARSFEDPKAEIREAGRRIFEPNFINSIKLYFLFMLPSISRFLTVRLMPTSAYTKYRSLVTETLKYRKENGIVRNDFLDAIKERRGVECTIAEITDQVGGFYIDGFGTNSIIISYMLYEVAANLDVQIRLRDEIGGILSKYGGQFAIEAMQEMDYLDAVISECLRKYPPLPHLTKRCTKPFTLPAANSASAPVTLEIDTPVVITLLGLHYDERHFPDPYKFNPDRFLGDNKEKITKCSYMPFGEGPRICLGMRFALMQSKVALSKVVSKYELRINPKTKLPLKFDPQGLMLAALGGIWIDFYKRTN